MNKVILVLSDGLRYDTAVAGAGTPGHLMEAKLASLYKVTGELPSTSRRGTRMENRREDDPTQPGPENPSGLFMCEYYLN